MRKARYEWVLALILYVAFLWPRYFYLSVAGKGLGVYVITTALALVGAFGIIAVSRTLAPTALAGITRSIIPILIVLAYYLTRLFADIDGDQPSASIMVTVQDFLTYGSWMIIGATMFTFNRSPHLITRVVLISIYVASGVALLEYATQSPFLDLVGLNRIAAGDQAQLTSIASASSELSAGLRMKSVFTHPIIFGQTMAMLLPFCVITALSGRPIAKLFAVGAIPLIIIDILLTQSRSALIVGVAAVAVALAIYLLDYRRSTRLAGFGLLALLGLIAAPSLWAISNDLASGTTRREIISSQGRKQQMDRGMSALRSAPYLGYGSGTSATYAGIKGRDDIMTVDNTYLSKVVETGYIGVAMFGFMLLSIFMFIGTTALGAAGSLDRGVLASWAGLVAAYSIGISAVSIYDSTTFLFMGLGYAIAYRGRFIIAVRKQRRDQKLREKTVGSQATA